MALSTASRTCLRAASRCTALQVRAVSTTPALRDAASSTYSSPFQGETKGTQIPDFGKYKSSNQNGNKLFSYFTVGTMGAISAAAGKSTVEGECDAACVRCVQGSLTG